MFHFLKIPISFMVREPYKFSKKRQFESGSSENHRIIFAFYHGSSHGMLSFPQEYLTRNQAHQYLNSISTTFFHT